MATDLNQPMLDQAARRLNDARVEWRQADALSLPFDRDGFDAVVCQFGAMFFPDKVRAYSEARRVLRPGGRYFFNVWDAIETNDFADAVTQALAEVFPDDPPRFLARTPHGYHDEGEIRVALHAAGFGAVSAEMVEARSRAPSAREAAVAYCQGTPLRNEIDERDAARFEEATNRAAKALSRRFGEGRVEGRIRALVFTAAR